MTGFEKRRILVVEDDPDIRVMMDFILRDKYSVTLCEDGRSGVARALADRPDLILLDIYMPGMSGFDVCKTIRSTAATSAIPIIILTAGAQKDEVAQGYALGVDDYLFKPFDPLELVERIEKLI